MDVKEKLMDMMRARNWTYYKLAKESNMSWSTVRNMFERGTEPTLPTLEALCGGLGITLADLLVGYSAAELTDEQKELLDRWDRLGDEDRRLCLDLMRALGRRRA